MKLEGIHHISAITGDAPGNVEFYTGVLGLRMVKQTVNQDEPNVYHLFYGDEHGSPGMDLTFFEYPGAAPGVAGAGMVHRIVWRVASVQALEFWQRAPGRARRAGGARGREPAVRRPRGPRTRARAEHRRCAAAARARRRCPRSMRCRASRGCAPTASVPLRSERLLAETLGFERRQGESWEVRGERRGAFYAYDPAPPEINRRQGAGTVHHVAFAAAIDELDAWRTRVSDAGATPTPVIERFYFKSVYFREPSGVLFEIATIGPGFAVDEDELHLGERLSLPAALRAAARAARPRR